MIFCATGYDTSFALPFEIVGRGGHTLNARWAAAGHPEKYLAMCVDGFPNYFFSCGPNAAVGTGSLLMVIEKQIDYIIMVAQKLQREHLKSIEVKPKAVRDFAKYVDVSRALP